MALDAVSNFVRGATSASIDSSQTTVPVNDASIFPDPSTDGEYNVVIWDADNNPRPDQDPDVEVMRVTAIDTTNDDLTVTRGQEGTSGAAHPSGSAIHLSVTAKMFGDIEDRYTAAGEDFDGQGTSSFTNLQLVSSESIESMADYIIDTTDDFDSVINGMSQDEVAIVAPRATFDVNTALTPPSGATIMVSGAPGRTGAPSTSVVKQFDGDLLELPDSGLSLIGLELDGNKANHTGDLITTPTNGTKEHYFERVFGHSASGDGFVSDGMYFTEFDRCRFANNGGVGIRHVSSGGAEVSQNTYHRSQFSKNSGAGVKWEGFTHTERYSGAVIASNGDAGAYSQGDTQNMRISGLVENNDGPAVLLDEATGGSATQQRGWTLNTRLVGNNVNASGSSVDSPGSRNVGAVHVQGTANTTTTVIEPWINAGTDADVVFATYSDYGSGNRSHYNQIGGATTGQTDFAHLDQADHTAVLMVDADEVAGPSLTSGSSGSGYNYDAAGGTAL